MDIRLKTSFFTHVKTIKLRKRLGDQGVVALLTLWTYCADHKSTGQLHGMNAEDVELAASWAGDSGKLFEALVEVGYIDRDGESISLHDWAVHQPWAANQEQRSRRAREAAERRWGKTSDESQMQDACNPHADSMQDACNPHTSRNAPSPSPSPSPSPLPKQTSSSRGKRAKVQSRVDALGFDPIAAWCEEFKDLKHQTPVVQGPDAKAIWTLTEHIKSEAQLRAIFKAFLKDPTPWLVDKFHPPRHLPERLNRYLAEIRRSEVVAFEEELDEGSSEPLPDDPTQTNRPPPRLARASESTKPSESSAP
ncbi:MAG: hypothetical protein M5U26_23220 [Planctomycetota bacterium]|nr:hypothetical protein [Planctomycetota bacterium]